MGIAFPSSSGTESIAVACGLPAGELDMAFVVVEGEAPNIFKWINLNGSVQTETSPNAAICSPHATTPRVAGVAASTERQRFLGLEVEYFSSAVTDPLVFDREGNRLEDPKIPSQPRFTGPDVSLFNIIHTLVVVSTYLTNQRTLHSLFIICS